MADRPRERGKDIHKHTDPVKRKQCTVCNPNQPGKVRHDEVWERAMDAPPGYRVEVDNG